MSCLESLKIIPFVLWSMEQEMKFRQFHQIVGKDLDESLFRNAITAPYANSVSNYEKLEFLGDRVVNLLCALSIFLKNSDEMSDTLTARLNKMSSNSALSYLAMSHSTAIGGFIIDSPFERKKWCPQGFQQKRERILSKKTIADVVEALSAVCFLSGNDLNIRRAAEFMRWLGLQIDIQIERCQFSHSPIDFSEDDSLELFIEDIGIILGYNFRRFEIVELLLKNKMTQSRLAFLGDNIFRLLVCQHIFTADPRTKLQDLSRKYKRLVKNKRLEIVCSKIGLSNIFGRYEMEWSMRDAKILSLRSALEQEACLSTTVVYFLKSLLGAVYIDSRGDLGCFRTICKEFLFDE
eukprot:475594_1